MYCTHKSSSFFDILGILMIAVLLVSGCGTEPEIDNDFLEDLGDIEAVYFEAIGQGSQASFDQRIESVVRDSVSWVEYQEKMETVLPFRDVDFSQLMVAFVAFPHDNGGVTIQFESAERVEQELQINYVVGLPGADCRIIDTPSVPFQVMVLPRFDLPVKFEYREETQYCTLD